MPRIYEIKCTPPNERSRVVRLQAQTLEEALDRAGKLWMHQQHSPQLLAVIHQEKEEALSFLV